MRAAEAAAPIAEGELGPLFAEVDGARAIALAVSGGADSLALLDCVDRWRRGRATPVVTVLTVDHGLRAESAAEAAMVAGIARERGFAHRILAWDGPHPEGDVEAAAREARYRLLLPAAREAGASHLLLAHHRDDQAETFLMRLSRGSGLFGLAAMRPAVEAGTITILRPFLALPRSRLAATTAAAGMVPAEDPMNRDPRFLRARLRRVMPLLAAEGFDAATIAATVARLRSAADAIEAAASAAIDSHVTTDMLGTVVIGAGLAELADEVRLRALVRILMAIGGEPYPPRGERVAALDAAMAAHSRGRFKRTLAGTVIERRGGRFVLYREAGRDGLPTLGLVPGSRSVWDHRFLVEAGADLPAGLTIGPLGEEARRAAAPGAEAGPPGALAALPAIRQGTAILAVPSLHIGERALPVTVTPITARRLQSPPQFPDFGEAW